MGSYRSCPCKGVFVAIGHAPATEMVKNILETHNGGILKLIPEVLEHRYQVFSPLEI
jgi:thioredoxin reductase (NADPH)